MTNGWRAKIRPLTDRLGIHSSAPVWQPLALHHYRRKSKLDAQFKVWMENEGSAWTRDHWAHESVTGTFEEMHVSSQLYELSEKFRQRIGDIGDASVLDAGASDGFFLAQLGIKNGVGANFLEACGRKIRADGYASILGDIEHLPFVDRSFDYVICSETLEHVPNPIATLDELARVARRRVFLTVPWLPRTRITARPAGWPETESHIFEFSVADFARIVSHTRLRIAFKDQVQVFPRPRNPVSDAWLRAFMYPNFFPTLQYYELEPAH